MSTGRGIRSFGVALFITISTLGVWAQPAWLSKDIVDGVTTGGSDPMHFALLGDYVYFSADSPGQGRELWRTDGTESGTALVADIAPGESDSSPFGLCAVGDTLFFVADDGTYGKELWASDGTSLGTYMVCDLTAGSGSSLLTEFVAFDGRLFFAAEDTDRGAGLFATDGTEAGTVLIYFTLHMAPNFLTVAGSKMFFFFANILCYVNSGEDHSWGVDPFGAYPGAAVAVGDYLYFALDEYGHDRRELYRSDGTEATTVRDFGYSNYDIAELVSVNGIVYFNSTTSDLGWELWKSDGTFEGTVPVRDIVPGTRGSYARNIGVANGRAIFMAHADSSPYQLWSSDGTESGTNPIASVIPGEWSNEYLGDPQYCAVGNTTYFKGSSSEGDAELWRSDGTTAGTYLVREIGPGTLGANPNWLTDLNGTLVFSARDGNLNTEPWRSDGTSEGTTVICEIVGNVNSGGIGDLVALGGEVYFAASESATGIELWRSDGTEAGTHLAADVRQGTATSGPRWLVAFDGEIYFAAYEPATGLELYSYDGATARLVKDINPGTENAFDPGPRVERVRFYEFNGALYFAANDGAGTGLWKTDGTEAGTQLVREVFASYSPSAELVDWTVVNGRFFFEASSGATATELWWSDGTTAGTELVAGFSYGIDRVTQAGNTLYVVGSDAYNVDHELYTSDGTAGGTALVLPDPAVSHPIDIDDAVELGGVLYFTADEAMNPVAGVLRGRELWKSDGTPGGTMLVRDINPGAADSDPDHLTVVDGRLVFVADDGVHGRELWISDGTYAGTYLLVDHIPGSGSIAVTEIAGIGNGKFVAGVYEPAGGTELWWSDGEVGNLGLLQDICPGPGSSSPESFCTAGTRRFFLAFDWEHGQELWSFDATADGDSDGLLDVFEGFGDVDGDGLANYADPDSDNDGLLDGDEPVGDPDGDGLGGVDDADSDDDGAGDAIEVALGTDPLNANDTPSVPLRHGTAVALCAVLALAVALSILKHGSIQGRRDR